MSINQYTFSTLKTLSFNSTGMFVSHSQLRTLFLTLKTLSFNSKALSHEQWLDIFEGCHCRQFSVNNVGYIYGFCFVGGAGHYFCLLFIFRPCLLHTVSPQTPLSMCPVFLHFRTSHSTHAPCRPRTFPPKVDPYLCVQLEHTVYTPVNDYDEQESTDPWCDRTFHLRLARPVAYTSFTILTYSSGTPLFLKHCNIRSIGIILYAFF